ncbi:MAG TPA: hypothetical protein VF937_13195, partial [Chloroflexota bacterium]
MTGRTRLTWVTALTIASLLLGGGALNALAEGRPGGGHGDASRAKTEHQQTVTDTTGRHDDGDAVVQAAPVVQPDTDTDTHGKADTAQADKHADADVARADNDNEDLVTPPSEATGETRPGLGCGDDNHVHTGPPGNPDLTCKG